MKIGILGGTFNPVHIGHLILAQYALGELNLDKIYFVPANIAPLKSRLGLIAPIHRLNMLKLAVKNNKKFRVSDIEIKRGGVSYTVDTLASFRKKGNEIFFISGSDSLGQLSRWKDFDKIQRIATFVVAARPGFKLQSKKRGIKFIRIPKMEISSSLIRARLRAKKDVSQLIDVKVLKYIKDRGLYGK